MPARGGGLIRCHSGVEVERADNPLSCFYHPLFFSPSLCTATRNCAAISKGDALCGAAVEVNEQLLWESVAFQHAPVTEPGPSWSDINCSNTTAKKISERVLFYSYVPLPIKYSHLHVNVHKEHWHAAVCFLWLVCTLLCVQLFVNFSLRVDWHYKISSTN